MANFWRRVNLVMMNFYLALIIIAFVLKTPVFWIGLLFGMWLIFAAVFVFKKDAPDGKP